MRSGGRRQRGERSGKLAERFDPRLGCGSFLAGPEVSIDPDRADAGRVRARDVARERVAHHDRLMRVRADPLERDLEDPPIGLPEPDLAGDNDRAEVAPERGARELLALDVRCAVRDQRESMVSGERAEDPLGFGIYQLTSAPRRPAGFGTLLRKRPV